MTPSGVAGAGLPLRAALLSLLVGVPLTTSVAATLQSPLGLSRAYPLWVSGVAMIVLTIACAGLRRHHPFASIGPANLVTGTRALLVAMLGGMAVDAAGGTGGWWVAGIATVAASLDLADGWLARRTTMASPFGARFDMEIDALLILILSALVWRAGLTGPWVLASGLMRYLFVAAAVVWPWMRRALPPSRRRQTVCVLQIAALIVALAPVTPGSVAEALAAGSLLLLAWSFATDVAWLWVQRDAHLSI